MLKTASVLCLITLTSGVVCLAQDVPVPAPAGQTEPLPAAPDATAPTPAKPHRKSFLQRAFSVEAVTATIPGAVLQQFHDWPEEWGRQRLGFEKRVASLYGQFVIGVAIEDTVKAIHHEDTTYRRLGKGNFFRRTAHVITDTVTARKPNGNRTMAYSLPANAYGSWAVATLWSPHEFRNPESIFEWGSAGLGASAGANFAKEFWPDIKKIFRKKKKTTT